MGPLNLSKALSDCLESILPFCSRVGKRKQAEDDFSLMEGREIHASEIDII